LRLFCQQRLGLRRSARYAAHAGLAPRIFAPCWACRSRSDRRGAAAMRRYGAFDAAGSLKPPRPPSVARRFAIVVEGALMRFDCAEDAPAVDAVFNRGRFRRRFTQRKAPPKRGQSSRRTKHAQRSVENHRRVSQRKPSRMRGPVISLRRLRQQQFDLRVPRF
jgi:hypothetical protein